MYAFSCLYDIEIKFSLSILPLQLLQLAMLIEYCYFSRQEKGYRIWDWLDYYGLYSTK